MGTPIPLPLDGCRILDLGGLVTAAATRWLADLGADVRIVDVPDLPPTIVTGSAREREAFRVAFDTGKSREELAAEGDGRLAGLIAEADVVFTGSRADALGRAGLDPDSLQRAHPSLVHVSVTAFGLTGPSAGRPATDLTLLAQSGMFTRNRFGDRRPLRISSPFHAVLHASGDAAIGALIGLIAREQIGLGQLVDVSLQESAMFANMKLGLFGFAGAEPPALTSGSRSPLIWPVVDGFVHFALSTGPATGHFSNRFSDWLDEIGEWDPRVPRVDWSTLSQTSGSGLTASGPSTGEWPLTPEQQVWLDESIGRGLRRLTLDEAMALSLERRLLIAPIHSARHVLQNPHFTSRGQWRTVEDASGRAVRIPGAYVRSDPPLIDDGASPPARGDAGFGGLTALGDAERGPLANVRVADFSWVMAGPSVGRMLADFGADVVKVESPTRLDLARALAPIHPGLDRKDGSLFYLDSNAGKSRRELSLQEESGLDQARRIALDSDVVLDSFSPGTMAKWGLDAASLTGVKPEIVTLSASLLGSVGPFRAAAGYGSAGGALSGSHYLTGWDDIPPTGFSGPYTDSIAPRFGVLAVLAALIRRQRSGIGAAIDQSQTESALQFLAPELVEYQLSGIVAERRANEDAAFAPNDVFEFSVDRGRSFVALSVQSDAQWAALLDILGLDDDPALAHLDLAGRLADAPRVYAALDDRLRTLDGERVLADLLDSDIPVGVVADHRDLAADPQLAHRGHFVRVAHPVVGEVTLESSRIVLSRTPARVGGVDGLLSEDRLVSEVQSASV